MNLGGAASFEYHLFLRWEESELEQFISTESLLDALTTVKNKRTVLALPL